MKPTDLMPVKEVRHALKSVKAEAYARGMEAGRAEATRMLDFAVRLNGHGPRTLKAILGEDHGNGTDGSGGVRGGLFVRKAVGEMADSPGNPEAVQGNDEQGASDPATSDLILLAYIDALQEAKEHHPDGDGGTIAEYLRGLLHDPEEGAAFVASLSDNGVSLKAFDESKHPRGDDGRFIGREAIHAAKSDPAKAEALRARTTDPAERAKLDAALEGKEDLGRTKAGLHKEKVEQTKKEKAERLQKVRTLAEEISMARRGGAPVPPEHYTELAAELPHLTRDQLRSVRTSLAASFFGRTRRDDMVTALVRHAKVKAEQLRADQADNDPLDFSIEAMSNTGGGLGHSDAARSELNPWRDFDKADGRRFGEAQHGGRIEQRQQVMNATDAPGKTSAGTPDTGSVLKIPGKVADEQLTQKLNADKQTSRQVTEDKPGERGGDWGDSLEPSGAASIPTAAASAPSGWVGDDLLLINHAYRHLKNTDPAYADMTLDQFKDQLIRENGKGVTLSRADLPQALDPNDVRESESQHPAMRGRHGGDFHFIKVPRNQKEAAKEPSSRSAKQAILDRIRGPQTADPDEWQGPDRNKPSRAQQALDRMGGLNAEAQQSWEKEQREAPSLTAEEYASKYGGGADLAVMRRQHKTLVQEALNRGDSVPDRVLLSHPDLHAIASDEAVASRPLRQQLEAAGHSPNAVDQVLASRLSGRGKRVDANTGASLEGFAAKTAERHRDAVKRLLDAGKPVPPEVLADYPDLKPATPSGTPAHVAMGGKIGENVRYGVGSSEAAKKLGNGGKLTPQEAVDYASREGDRYVHAGSLEATLTNKLGVPPAEAKRIMSTLKPAKEILVGTRKKPGYDVLDAFRAAGKLEEAEPPKNAAVAHAAADEYAKEAKTLANTKGANPDAAMAHGEAANALRGVAKIHEQIDAERARREEELAAPQRVAKAEAKVSEGQAAVDAARSKEEAAKAKAAELKAEGDPKERIAKLKEQLAASKAKKAGEPAAVPPPASPPPAPSSVSGFNPEAAVRVAADDITKLRKSDVFRVVEWSPPESRAAVADYISQHRPDLHGELAEVTSELGVAAPQSGSKPGGTFSDNDFSNGNTHEKKIGPASLQYGVNENTGRIELYSLRVPGSHRRKGAAKDAMKAFLAEADQRGLPVELLASPLDKKTNLGKLVNFYQSLGFEVVGRGNPAGDPKMLRKPQPAAAKSFSAWDALREELGELVDDVPPG